MKRALNQVSFHQILVLDHIKVTGFYRVLQGFTVAWRGQMESPLAQY